MTNYQELVQMKVETDLELARRQLERPLPKIATCDERLS